MAKIKCSNTEENILRAAEKLFYERGYAMTHTTDIAKEAGCNQALVHYYYRSKEKLFEQVFESKLRLFVSVFLSIGNEEKNFEDKLRKKIEAHFEILRKNPRLPFLLLNEFSTNPNRLNSFRANLGKVPEGILQRLDEELQELANQGVIRHIRALDLMLSIISLNAIIFMAEPVIKTMIGSNEKQFKEILEQRKSENVEIILSRLRPATVANNLPSN
jgi:AcrR family transcriptional regulator